MHKVKYAENGRAFFLGYKKTAIYMPSGTNAPGTWTAGPDIPEHLNCGDTPAAMMVNGRIVVAAATKLLDGSTRFFDYDYLTNAFTPIDGPTGLNYAKPAYLVTFLTLPDGSVLMSSASTQLYQYVPSGTPLQEGKPVITSLSHNNDGTYHLTGTLLNGISEGASYGDDAQMATNYPIIRLTDGSSIYYARTFNWSSTGVMTGSTVLSTEFSLPVGIPNGTYSIVAVANGIASDAMTVQVPFVANNSTPTIQMVAMASVSQQSIKNVNLSVLGADTDSTGESNLIYTWRMSAGSFDVAQPSFSINGTNAAKLTTASVQEEGNYTFDVIVTDSSGASVISSASVTVDDVIPVIASPINVSKPIYSFIDYNIELQDSGFGHTIISTSNLPDGLLLLGSKIRGSPRTVGHYNVTLTAINSKGTDSKQLVIDVTDLISVTTKDSDSDGFPDELETYLSTNPLDSNSKPFAGAQANPVSLTVVKLQIKTDLRNYRRDTMLLTGSLAVPNGLNLAGLPVIVDVGGVVRSFTLNAKGSDTSKRDQHFKFATKSVGGSLGFSMTLNTTVPTSFSAQLEDEGLINDDITLTVEIPIIMLLNNTYYSTTVNQPYVGKSRRMGISKK